MRFTDICTLLLAVVVVICFLGTAPPLPAQLQPQELGNPFIHNFSAQEYGAFFQNWCVVQDHRGLIYVGNNSGVLEYDGVRWHLIRTKNRTMVRSLAMDSTGRIYVGAQREFGYLAPNANGEMDYVSLMEHVAPADRAISDIWSICFLGDRIYFQSLERLFCIKGDTVRVWKPKNVFQPAFTVHDRLYITDADTGLMVLDDDVLKPVPGGERFIGEKIWTILPWDFPGSEKNGLLICTQGQGLFLSDGKEVKPFPTLADAALQKAQLYRVLLLADGTLGIATLQGGFLHLSRDGRWLGHVGEEEGLPIESVKYLFQDSQLGLWLALGKGISRVEVASPVTTFDKNRGVPGTVFSIHRHQGTLYAGTDQGLFRLDPADLRGPFFAPIDGLQGAVWDFVSWGDNLLVANYNGVYEVRGTKAVPIRKSATVNYTILRSRHDPERLFIGLPNGLASCRWEGGRWVDKGMVMNMAIQVFSLYEAEDGSLWVGTYAQGVLHISFSNGVRHGNPRVESFGTEQGLPSLNHTYVYKLANGFKVTSHAGIYRYREDIRRFEADPAFAKLFPDGQRWIYDLEEDGQGRIWMHSCDETRNINESGAAVLQPDGTYRWEGQPCIRFSGNWVTAILPEKDGVVWFGTTEGLMRLDSKIPKQYDRSFHALVRRVSTMNGRPIFGGTWPGPPAAARIPYADNRLHFEFAATSFDLESANRHQVFLEGYDTDWCAWNTEWFKEYTNLPEGSYRFRVRARNLYGMLSSEDTFAFRVLPPWYRTWWAYILWFIGAGAVLIVIIRLYTLKLRREKDHLENIVAERTQQLREASEQLREASLTDPLTGLRNRRFILEVLQSDISAFIKHKHYLLNDKTQRRTTEEDTVFGIFLMDIDFFKKVNDTYGHDAGDRVLKQFSMILSGSVRLDDAVMRVGGEEFLVMLKKTKPEYLPIFAAKVLGKVAGMPFDIGGGTTIRKTCSIGYTIFPFYKEQPGLLTFDQSIMVADLGLFHAKNHGRNQSIYLRSGPRLPSGEDIIQKTLTSLEFALQEGYLKIEESPK